MALKREEIRHIAMLARLRLTDEEEGRFGEQLGRILDHVHTLDKLDTSGIEPMAHASDINNALREDRVTNEPNIESILANAPVADATFFRVPKIIE